MKIRDKLDQETDNLLEEVWRLKRFKSHIEATCPELLDLEAEGYMNINAYGSDNDIHGDVYVGADEGGDIQLGTQLLALSSQDSIVKRNAFSKRMNAAFHIDDRVQVVLSRKHLHPCRKVKVRDKREHTIEVCGEVDTDRYEIVEVLDA